MTTARAENLTTATNETTDANNNNNINETVNALPQGQDDNTPADVTTSTPTTDDNNNNEEQSNETINLNLNVWKLGNHYFIVSQYIDVQASDKKDEDDFDDVQISDEDDDHDFDDFEVLQISSEEDEEEEENNEENEDTQTSDNIVQLPCPVCSSQFGLFSQSKPTDGNIMVVDDLAHRGDDKEENTGSVSIKINFT